MHRHALLKAHELHRDLALVVVHGHHAVVAARRADGAHKGGVGWKGAVGGKAHGGSLLHTRRDDAAFLVAIVAVVAVVRIESTHRDARVAHARGLQGLRNHADGVSHFAWAKQA